MSEEDTQATEATSSDEEVVLEETTDTEDVVTLTKEEHAELLKKAEQVPNVVARAKKAESEAKALREKYEKSGEATQVNSNTLSADDVDVKILQSQGMSEDLITELKALAKVRGTSILATQIDPIFVAIKEKKETEEKNAKASLGASRGSGQVKAKKSPATPNLSPEEHRELWKKAQGLE